jgi:pyruvate dehydrogenase (quinone)
LDEAKGFSIWMMKAVLNGQGTELIELARSAWER